MGRRSLLVLISSAVGAISGYVALAFMIRLVGVVAAGIVGFAFAFASLLAIIGDLGLGAAHAKRVSEGRDVRRCLGAIVSMRAALGGAYILGIQAALFVLKLGGPLESPEHEAAVHLMSLYMLLMLVGDVLRITYYARLEVAKAHLPIMMENLSRSALIVAIAAIHSSARPWTETGAALLLCVAYVLGAAVHLVALLACSRGLGVARPDRALLRSYAAFAAPTFASAAFSMILPHIDKVLLQVFWGAQAVGEYFAVQKVTDVVTLGSMAASGLLFPLMSSVAAREGVEGVRRLAPAGERYLVLFTLPLVLPLVVVPGPIVAFLLGPEVAPAAPVVPWLALAGLVAVANNVHVLGTAALDRPIVWTQVHALQLGLNVVLILSLVPTALFGLALPGLGTLGAALALFCAQVVAAAVLRARTWSLYRLPTERRILFPAGAAAAAAGVGWLLSGPLTAGSGGTVLVLGILGVWGAMLGVLLGLLHIMGEFTAREARLLRAVLDPQRFFRYLAGETRGAPPPGR